VTPGSRPVAGRPRFRGRFLPIISVIPKMGPNHAPEREPRRRLKIWHPCALRLPSKPSAWNGGRLIAVKPRCISQSNEFTSAFKVLRMQNCVAVRDGWAVYDPFRT
jgi:hypothetical protein